MLPPWLVTWLVYSIAFWLTALVLPGFKVDGFAGAVVSAAVFGLLNWILGRLLYGLLGVATLGIGFLLGFLTTWIVNAILLKLADSLTRRLEIRSFGIAFIGGLMITVLAEFAKRLILHPPSGGRMIWV
jgi:putative membrane protein